jgi:hypothetical protein
MSAVPVLHQPGCPLTTAAVAADTQPYFAWCSLRRSVGMLQARSTVDGIFSDLGLEAESLNQLKVGQALPCQLRGGSVAACLNLC